MRGRWLLSNPVTYSDLHKYIAYNLTYLRVHENVIASCNSRYTDNFVHIVALSVCCNEQKVLQPTLTFCSLANK